MRDSSQAASEHAVAAELDQGLLVRRAAKFDTAGLGESVVCEFANGNCVQMSPSAYWLYRELQCGRTAAQITTAIRDRFGQQVSVDEVATASARLLERIRDQSQSVGSATRRRYVFRLRLVPERVVARLAGRLTWLISCPALGLWTCGVAASAILFWMAGPSALGMGHLNLGSAIIKAYLIYLLALAAHELGHAAASERYGIAAGEIGFAIYLIFPAIYCDVTRAWLLPRKQRLVVDIAGILFEIGIGAIYSAVGVIFHAPVFVLASFMILGNLIMTLNPIGRFDTYWALSDAFGIADLSKQRSRLLHLGSGGHGNSGSGQAMSYVGLRRVVITGYSMLTVLIVGWYCYTATRMAAPFADDLKLTAAAMGRNFGSGRTFPGLRDLLGIGPGVLMLGLMLYLLGRMLASLLRKLTHARASRSRFERAERFAGGTGAAPGMRPPR